MMSYSDFKQKINKDSSEIMDVYNMNGFKQMKTKNIGLLNEMIGKYVAKEAFDVVEEKHKFKKGEL